MASLAISSVQLYPASPVSQEQGISPQSENLATNEQERLQSELLEIVDDMCIRLTERNPSYNSGVYTFIRRYKTLKQRTISTPCIASALHLFGSEGELKLIVL